MHVPKTCTNTLADSPLEMQPGTATHAHRAVGTACHSKFHTLLQAQPQLLEEVL